MSGSRGRGEQVQPGCFTAGAQQTSARRRLGLVTRLRQHATPGGTRAAEGYLQGLAVGL